MTDSNKLHILHWPCKSIIHGTRMLLAYLGVEYTEAYPKDHMDWLATKKKLIKEGFHLPNLPLLTHGDYKLTETIAIPEYICKVANRRDMLGKTPQDEGLHTALRMIYLDIRKLSQNHFSNLTNYEECLKRDRPALDQILERLSNFLGDKDYFLGYLTVFDFEIAYFYEYFYHMYVLSLDHSHPYEKHANLVAHYKRVYNIPAVKEFNSTNKIVNIIPPGYIPWFVHCKPE